MTTIVWDEVGKKLYEAGVDRGVLYVKSATGTYEKGVGWNGLTKVSESPEGAEATAKYANNNKYLNLISQERFKGQISAYTYPSEWDRCQGALNIMNSGQAIPGLRVTGQTRSDFGFTYRTLLGNDTQGTDYGYILHIVYNATAGVSSRENNTINESPDAVEFSWDFDTVAVPVPGMKPSAHLLIDSTTVDATKLKALEDTLYGTTSSEPKLPTPEELVAILSGTTTKPANSGN